jgi:hypothetical protein
MNASIDFGVRGGNAAIIEFDTSKQNKLVRDFDKQLDIRKRNLLDLGRIARDLKALHITQGQRQKGKGWEAFLQERHLSRSTVDEWILEYERSIGAREHKSVLPESGRTNGENKGASFLESVEEEDVIESTSNPSPIGALFSKQAAPDSYMDSITTKDGSKPEGRSNVLFKTAVNLYGSTGDRKQALAEWDAVSARVRNYLVTIQITPEEKVNHSRRQHVDGLE